METDFPKVRPESDTDVMHVIRYCEAKRILNEWCNLSTIESLKRQSPAKVKAYLAIVKATFKPQKRAVRCPGPECKGIAMRFSRKAALFRCPTCKLYLRFKAPWQ